MKPRKVFTKWRTRVMAGLALLIVAASADPSNFLAQRRKFRDEIKNKTETKLDAAGNYLSVIFKGEEGKYKFSVTPDDRGRLKKHMAGYFGASDDALLGKMVDELDSGHYVIYKEYKDDGVVLKVIFLSPTADYWPFLTDGNGIENMFHTYNFSVGLGNPSADAELVVLQTEGAFLGVTQAVSLPIQFEKDAAKREYKWRMPSQSEIVSWVAQMPAADPARTKPEEKFIDACRTHPYFQQKNGNAWTIGDDEIIKLFNTTVTNLDRDCPVKANQGYWLIHEDYPYLVVDYNFTTKVNIQAFIPESLSFLSGTVGDIAQSITDEVSVKYLPLSMRNFRDYTQAHKPGAPQ